MSTSQTYNCFLLSVDIQSEFLSWYYNKASAIIIRWYNISVSHLPLKASGWVIWNIIVSHISAAALGHRRHNHMMVVLWILYRLDIKGNLNSVRIVFHILHLLILFLFLQENIIMLQYFSSSMKCDNLASQLTYILS